MKGAGVLVEIDVFESSNKVQPCRVHRGDFRASGRQERGRGPNIQEEE